MDTAGGNVPALQDQPWASLGSPPIDHDVLGRYGLDAKREWNGYIQLWPRHSCVTPLPLERV